MLPDGDAVLCQQEIPVETVEAASFNASAEFFLNAAPARDRVPAADVTIVNSYELEALPNRSGVIAVTLGAEGAILLEDGNEVARAAPPPVEAVDGTAAGDAFTACLVVSLLEGRAREPRRARAGAIAASRFGAQTSPRQRRSTRSYEHAHRHRDPGHDDAIVPRLRSLARGRAPGTTVAANQTPRRATLKILALAGRATSGCCRRGRALVARCASRERTRAARRRSQSRRRGRGRARSRLPRRADRAEPCSFDHGPLTNVALLPSATRIRDRLDRSCGAGRRRAPAAELNASSTVAAAVFERSRYADRVDVIYQGLLRGPQATRGAAGSVVASLDFFQRFHEWYAFDGRHPRRPAAAHVIDLRP